MPTLDTLESTSIHKVLIFGPPKSGKTVAVGQLANSGYTLDYLNIENGVGALLNVKNLPVSARKNINVINIPDTPKRPCAAETVMKILEAIANPPNQPLNICNAHGKINCPVCSKQPDAVISSLDLSRNVADLKRVLVLDSWTQFRQSILQIVFGTVTPTELGEDPRGDKAALQLWGKVTNYITAASEFVQASQCHIVVISHEEMVTMEDKKTKLVPVGGTTNFSKNFAKSFDDVVYMEVSGGRHIALSNTTARPNIVTGSRAGHDTSIATAPGVSPLLGIFAS